MSKKCKKQAWIAVIALLCVMCASLCVAQGEMPSFQFSTPSASEPEPASAQSQWTYPIPLEILEDSLDVIRLVNVDNLLDSSYPPKDELHTLMDATVKKSKNVEMEARTIANDALIAMFDAATNDGMTLLLHSAYRSHYTQAVMHENYVKRTGKDDGVVQKPGGSDHQTGLGFDVINPEWAKKDRFTAEFAKTAEAQWMATNCARFGFIIRYPEGKTDITGITYEPWHLRYVGVEVATYMTDNALTLEEFTAQWRDAVGTYYIQNGEQLPATFSF